MGPQRSMSAPHQLEHHLGIQHSNFIGVKDTMTTHAADGGALQLHMRHQPCADSLCLLCALSACLLRMPPTIMAHISPPQLAHNDNVHASCLPCLIPAPERPHKLPWHISFKLDKHAHQHH